MIPHDILTLYSAKMVEYGIAVAFLLLFIPYWRFVQGGETAQEPARSEASEWFPTPEGYLFHRGHAWARLERTGVLTVGLDALAARLPDGVTTLTLPTPGQCVGQGDIAWQIITADGTPLDMLSPVDGTVIDVNPEVIARPERAVTDPYGTGWLLMVRPTRLRANRTNLLTGRAAAHWMREVAASLLPRVEPELGLLAQDGGAPVTGLAKAINPEQWEQVARHYLLTTEDAHHA